MAYIGVNPIDLQTTVISGAQTTATLKLAHPTQTTKISGAFLRLDDVQDLPDVAGMETQADYNVWLFEAFNSHTLVDTTLPNVPVDGELYFDTATQALSIYDTTQGEFVNTQKGPFALIEKLASLSGDVAGDYLPLQGGTIATPVASGLLMTNSGRLHSRQFDRRRQTAI